MPKQVEKNVQMCFFENQARPRGFKKGVSSVYNQPVISAMIFSDKWYI